MIESLLTGAWRRITNEIARSPLMVILIASMWFISLYVFPTVTKNVVDARVKEERSFFQWHMDRAQLIMHNLVYVPVDALEAKMSRRDESHINNPIIRFNDLQIAMSDSARRVDIINRLYFAKYPDKLTDIVIETTRGGLIR